MRPWRTAAAPQRDAALDAAVVHGRGARQRRTAVAHGSSGECQALTAGVLSHPLCRRYAHDLSEQLSQPSIMFKAKLTNGKEIMLDDYREAYW